MKKAIMVMVLIVALCASASAQMKMNAYAGGGLAMPMSPSTFTDYWKMGLGVGAGIGFQPNEMFEIGASFGYHTCPLDISGVDGLDFKFLEVMADVKYLIPTGESKFTPYIAGSVGIINVKVTDLETGTTTLSGPDETKLGFGFGAGFIFDVSPSVGIFVDGRYKIVTTEGESTGYLPIMAGFKYYFASE
jgi:opacity protein-like surface antigen